LAGAYRLGKRPIRQLAQDLFGLSISTGMVAKLEQSTAETLEQPLAELESHVRTRPVNVDKIVKDRPEAKRVATTAVRMPCQAEKPFCPYREPEDQRPAGAGVSPRLLRVFFLGAGRVQGTLGAKGKAWPGQVVWANKVSAADREKLLDLLKLPKDTPPAAWHLTEFEDRSTPRPGSDDVFFGPTDDPAPVERPPSILFVSRPLPDDVMAYALVAFLLTPWARRRWRRWRAGWGEASPAPRKSCGRRDPSEKT
jgi:hypothetical protein